jgi:prefoldin subunit 5
VYGPYAAPSPEQETEYLKAQAEWLKGQLDAISQRIAELEEGE